MTDQEILEFLKKNNLSPDSAFYELKDKGVLRTRIRAVAQRAGYVATRRVSGKGPKTLEKELTEAKEKLAAISKMEQGVRVHTIERAKDTGVQTEATPVIVASDWHIEEEVKSEWVNGLNKHDLQESRKRADLFFKNALKLTEMFEHNVKINTVVLALLGDFFSNDIHDELAEINLLPPMEACLLAQEYLTSGIQFLLDNSTYNITVIGCSGNHARTTDENYFSAESGHSLEYYMYRTIEQHFSKEKRLRFIVQTGYHVYLDVLGYKIRFHHGHAIRYGGGIGGLFVPAYKKIDKWNNAMPVNLDVFGHHHQYKDGGTFISNGSMIGYNAYALRNGFGFERPQQAYFLVDARRGRTISAPILFN